MKTYSKFSPTEFDRAGAFLPDRQEWLVLPVSQNRDSGPLDQSNFAKALEILGGESEDVEIHRFGHWGPGWFEIIIVNPGNAELVKQAEDIERSLENYPVLNDEDYSRREWECFQESWESWGRRDYQKELAKKLFADFAEGVSEDFQDSEIDDALGELSPEAIDSLRDEASKGLGWLYEPDGDGVTINLAGLVERTDTDKLADICIEHCREMARQRDIQKLARHLGANDNQIKELVRLDLRLVSQIQTFLNSAPSVASSKDMGL